MTRQKPDAPSLTHQFQDTPPGAAGLGTIALTMPRGRNSDADALSTMMAALLFTAGPLLLTWASPAAVSNRIAASACQVFRGACKSMEFIIGSSFFRECCCFFSCLPSRPCSIRKFGMSELCGAAGPKPGGSEAG